MYSDPNSLIRRGEVDLDAGLADIKKKIQTLDELCQNLPKKEYFKVGIGNCETYLRAEGQISIPDVKTILTYVFSLPPEHQPQRTHLFGSRSDYKELEQWLNGVGKTMRVREDSDLNRFPWILIRWMVASDGSYGWIKDLKRPSV